jgi:hypothetical protein
MRRKILISRKSYGRPCTMSDEKKRIKMIYILGELRDACASDALKTIMTEADPYLVSKAVEATGKIGGYEAMEQLQIMMHHPSFIVRGEVAIDHPKRDELLNQLLNDTSSYVATCASLVLNENNVNLKRKDTQERRYCCAKRCDEVR